jgi:trigger factor
VPAKVAEKYLNQQALADEVINKVINQTLVKIINDEQVQLVDKPEVKVTKFVPFELLEFTVVLSVLPPVKLGGYMDLKAKYIKPEVKDGDVDKLIDNLRTQQAERKAVKRTAKNGDEVVIDFVGRQNGVEFAGGKAEALPLILGSNQMIPGFESGIEGHKAGEEFVVKVKFPKQYNKSELAGKPAEFTIKLTKVSELVEPELDDKFAAKIGPFYTVKELKEAAKKELVSRAEFESLERFRAELLAELVKKSKLELPAVLVDDQIRALENEAEDNFKYRGLTAERYFQQNGYADRADWIKNELEPEAEKRIKNGLVLAELAKAEKIEVSEAEIDERQKQIVSQYNKPELQERFNSPESRRNIANRIVTEKALDKLVNFNK